ncbi:Acyl carrier protein [Parafrankia irregularis]|uniref:Acyl carrier protein n=1 Tax=Parafrankia irregularis TaxID=795642 RepID=A0A0S4QXZ4_9ACTN|nr:MULTISPECIES: acyl carrier protein [Parafrankia]MBE3205766.1 acyl carrier protein [Parafrankia sp. CH37]CUU59640.1 Acyl carrier protein [Parafrankia irregularis]
MGEDEAVALVTTLICRFRKVEASQVPPDADLADTLGFDSLDAAEILAAVHKETGREVEVCSLADLSTVAGIARHLVAAGAGS